MATQNFAHAFQIESRQGICVLIPKEFTVPSNVLAVPLMPSQKINDIALGFGVDLIGAIEQHGEFTQSEPRFTGTFPFQAFTIKCPGFLFGLEVAGYLSTILRPGAPPTVSRTVKKNAHGSKTTGCAHGRSSQRFTLPVFHHIHTQKGKNALIQFRRALPRIHPAPNSRFKLRPRPRQSPSRGPAFPTPPRLPPRWSPRCKLRRHLRLRLRRLPSRGPVLRGQARLPPRSKFPQRLRRHRRQPRVPALRARTRPPPRRRPRAPRPVRPCRVRWP